MEYWRDPNPTRQRGALRCKKTCEIALRNLGFKWRSILSTPSSPQLPPVTSGSPVASTHCIHKARLLSWSPSPCNSSLSRELNLSNEMCAQHSNGAMEQIQATLTDFHSHCDDWERELDGLLEELDTVTSSADGQAGALSEISREQALVRDDLAEIRSFVDRQTQIFETLMSTSDSPVRQLPIHAEA